MFIYILFIIFNVLTLSRNHVRSHFLNTRSNRCGPIDAPSRTLYERLDRVKLVYDDAIGDYYIDKCDVHLEVPLVSFIMSLLNLKRRVTQYLLYTLERHPSFVIHCQSIRRMSKKSCLLLHKMFLYLKF